jgi:dTDP-4-amino-4,6-dideoxygalactose transaminase
VLNAIEGGVVTTEDAWLADRIRRQRNFGFAGYDRVEDLGINAKMNELSAAMALTGLDSLDWFFETNRGHYDRYHEHLGGVAGLRMVEYDTAEQNNYHYVVLEVEGDGFGLTRDDLAAVLHAENVLARRYFFPGCHRMEPYRTFYPEAGERLPVTSALCNRTLALPTGTALSRDEVDRVAELIMAAHAAAPSLSHRLRPAGTPTDWRGDL